MLLFSDGSSLGDLLHDVEFVIFDTSGKETGHSHFLCLKLQQVMHSFILC
jgi:hypothetical protein